MEHSHSPEYENTPPTTREIVQAAFDYLLDEDKEFMEDMEPEEAIGYLFTCLPEYGIADPEGFLIQKGILQGRAPQPEE